MKRHNSREDSMFYIFIAFVFAGIILCLIPRSFQGSVIAHKWQRSIEIEQYQVVHHSKSYHCPSDAYNVESWFESEISYYDSEGNPVWEDQVYYRYDVDRWVPFDELVSTGYSENNTAAPYWPSLKAYQHIFNNSPVIGNKRKGKMTSLYVLVLDCQSKKYDYSCSTVDEWRSFSVKEQVSIKMNTLGSIFKVSKMGLE